MCMQTPHHKYDQNHILPLNACVDTKITCIVMKSETHTGTGDLVRADRAQLFLNLYRKSSKKYCKTCPRACIYIALAGLTADFNFLNRCMQGDKCKVAGPSCSEGERRCGKARQDLYLIIF